MPREVIGQGWENNVSQSRREGWVLKTPRLPIILMNTALGYGVERIRQEVEEDRQLAESSTILRIPDTRVFLARRRVLGITLQGYVMAQRFIDEDGSVSEIEEKLRAEGQNLMADRYNVGKGNFISNKGDVYFVDPTHFVGRIFDKFRIPKESGTDLQGRLTRLLKG